MKSKPDFWPHKEETKDESLQRVMTSIYNNQINGGFICLNKKDAAMVLELIIEYFEKGADAKNVPTADKR